MNSSTMTTTRGRRSRLGVVLAAALTLSSGTAPRVQQMPAAKPSVTVYKSPTCGCCSKWVDHMRTNGFDVKALDVEDIDTVKRTYGVPPALGSCHTSLVGGYVVEGHVPADAVTRLLRERPKVAGLAVPGMPVGSPGMEVAGHRDPYSIVSFEKTGKYAIYERR
jgi:hypothetical protein